MPVFFALQMDSQLARNVPLYTGDLDKRNFVAYYVKHGKVMAAAGAGSVAQKSAIAELMSTDQMPGPDELRKK